MAKTKSNMFFSITVFAYVWCSAHSLIPMYNFKCDDGYCRKTLNTNETLDLLSLSTCRLLCTPYAGIWPKPMGDIRLGKALDALDVDRVDVEGYAKNSSSYGLFEAAAGIFVEQVRAKYTPKDNSTGKPLLVHINIENSSVTKLTLETNESYTLTINSTEDDAEIQAFVTAPNFFGARHGLQTLTQLIVFDDVNNTMKILSNVSISDGPVFPYRGVALDTARNYITVDAIKRTLRGMGATKLNTFHWHLSDSHSFPFVLKSHPELAQYGAYSPSQVYTVSDVEDLIEYARVRGVRILPEFDAPAHVGEGWQESGFLTCFNWQPYNDYCYEPPCGSFDPTIDGLYDVLEDIYGELLERFEPDIFHMGGDEVHLGCWKATDTILQFMKNQSWSTSEAGFVKVWDYFQNKSAERLYRKAGREIPVVMWTSLLTDPAYVETSLPKDKYIIQVWDKGNDKAVVNLIEKGYRLILSQYDVLYLDCGFGAWATAGNIWCSPYHGWHEIYENSPSKYAGDKTHQLILGEEVALWTEVVDSASVDSRIWPRSAALSELLWSNPTTGWLVAQERFLNIREQLIALGISADAVQPQWCRENEGNCNDGARPSGGYRSFLEYKLLLLLLVCNYFLTRN